VSGAGTIAFEALKRTLIGTVEIMRALPQVELVRRCAEIVGEIEAPPETTIGEMLIMAASQGSIEAIAAMAAIGMPDERVLEALRGIADRSPDVCEGAQVEALAVMFEEVADEEVAAGRMTVSIGPKGEKLYAPVHKRGKRRRR
jgi:hypothetical protein